MRLTLLALFVARAALAQEPSTPPPQPSELMPPAPVQAPPPLPTYAQQCFGYPSGAYLMPLPRVGTSLSFSGNGGSASGSGSTSTSSSDGSSGSIGGGGSGDGKALLVLAVLIAVALPVVIYAIDDDAPRIVQQRFECPSFQLDLMGGVDTGVAFPGARGVGQGRFTMNLGSFGTDVQFDLSPAAVNVFNAHALLRLSPKLHLEPAIAVGYRRLTVGSSVRQGFDVGLPHRYVFWRDDLRSFGLELRPSLMFGPSGIDPALEAALTVPLIELIHFRLGGRVFSYGNAIVLGANAGVSLTI
jgi:hypothetical protein